MELQFQLTPEDYVHAQFLNMRPRPVFKYLGIAILTLVFLSFVGDMKRLIIHQDAYYLRGVLMTLCMPLSLFALYCGTARDARRVFNQQKDLHEPFKAVLTEEGFHYSSETGNLFLKWVDFHKYRIGKKMILVYQSDALMRMFPKRWFSDAEFEEFKKYLSAALGNPK